jgi:fluoride exporter
VSASLAVALGAALGAPSRLLLDRVVTRRCGGRLPWGTLAVNLSGSALLGLLAARAARGGLAPISFDLGAIGFCGAFTTFSTFVWESLALFEEGASWRALANVGGSLLGGIGLAALLFALAKR